MVVFGPRVCTAVCVILSLAVASPALSQTAPAKTEAPKDNVVVVPQAATNAPPAPVISQAPQGDIRQAPLTEGPATDVTPDTTTIFGRRRTGVDARQARIDRNSSSSCGFMEEYDANFDDVTQDYLESFGYRVEDGNYNFNENSPSGDASTSGDRTPSQAMTDNREGTPSAQACAASDRAFAAGRHSIARRDKSLQDAYKAFDAGDYANAIELFRKSYTKMGYDSAALMLGKMYLSGMGTKSDTKQAVDWLIKVAEARFEPSDTQGFDENDPFYMTARSDAAMLLGKIYLTGWGVAKDPKQARKWYMKADTYGFIPGTHIVGRLYQYGFGGEKNVKEAVKYYTKAGTAGYAPSQYTMGIILYDGEDGIPADRKVAAEWWAHAAKRGHPDALFEIGRLYDLGEIFEADVQKAIVYYKEAALKGQAEAQVAIGTFFYTGEIVGQDLVVARKWFQMAAEQGNSDGMFNLAVMLSKGEGGGQDRAVALIWFRLAEQQGLEKAGKAGNVLEPKLTPEEKARANTVLQELKAGG